MFAEYVAAFCTAVLVYEVADYANHAPAKAGALTIALVEWVMLMKEWVK